MRLYRIMLKDFGETHILDPSIPINTANGENNTTPRICTAPTIIQCIYSLELFSSLRDPVTELDAYVYYIDTDDSVLLHFPTVKEVPDVWASGEVWILNPCKFKKLFDAKLRKHMYIPNSAYARYSFMNNKCDPSDLPDFITARSIYGESDFFSFIEVDYDRRDKVLNTADINDYYRP